MAFETVVQENEHDFQWPLESGCFADQQCHQLMIFTGLHTGATMPLADGTYSLGRSYECDIVLKDPGIEPVHLKVICNSGVVALRPELGSVYTNGYVVGGETILPESPVVVTIADVHWGLAVKGAAWCPLAFPEIQKNASPALKENTEARDHSGHSQGPRTPMATAVLVFKATARHLRETSTLGKLVPVAFILLFTISAAFLFPIKVPENVAVARDIEKQFSQWRLDKPVCQIDPHGFLDLTAYVPNVSRKEEISTFLKKLPLAVKDHVYVDEQIEWALQDYIARMAFPVEAAYQGGGRALVKGFVENQQEADTLVSLLKSNVTGLHTVNLHVRPLDQLRPEWEAILKDSSLADKIILRPQAGHLLAEGTLNGEERLRWNTAKKAIVAHLGRPADIVEQIQARETLKDIPGKIDIPIAGVTMAPYPFITLQDGKVYFKGACFQNGTVIKDIGPKRIIVEIDGRDYYYNF